MRSVTHLPEVSKESLRLRVDNIFLPLFGLMSNVCGFRLRRLDEELALEKKKSFCQSASGISRYGFVCLNILRNQRACPYCRVLANGQPAENSCTAADAGPPLNDRWNNLPVSVRLQSPVRVSSPRIFVVEENDAVPDKDLVLDRDPLTNKGVARDFTVAAYPSAFLNFDERPNLAAIADFTAVEVDEVVDDYIAAEFNVRRDYTKLLRHESVGTGSKGAV